MPSTTEYRIVVHIPSHAPYMTQWATMSPAGYQAHIDMLRNTGDRTVGMQTTQGYMVLGKAVADTAIYIIEERNVGEGVAKERT